MNMNAYNKEQKTGEQKQNYRLAIVDKQACDGQADRHAASHRAH